MPLGRDGVLRFSRRLKAGKKFQTSEIDPATGRRKVMNGPCEVQLTARQCEAFKDLLESTTKVAAAPVVVDPDKVDDDDIVKDEDDGEGGEGEDGEDGDEDGDGNED